MRIFRQICFGIVIAAVIAIVVGIASGNLLVWSLPAVVGAVAIAIGFGTVPVLRPYQFTAWIVTGVVVAMIYPSSFLHIGTVNLRDKTLILLIMQIVMFGMGTQMSLSDFVGVARMPYAVLIGSVLHFTVMPLVGFTLATLFGFPSEIAAGIVLIGSCSSGLASNVMAYIAKANLPLSITVTSVTTLLAPVMTPTWMKLLASKMITVDFASMMIEIIKLIIVPIGAAMLDECLEHASPRVKAFILTFAALASSLLIAGLLGGRNYLAGMVGADTLGLVDLVSYFLGAVVAGVVYRGVKQQFPAIVRLMPRLSMLGIVYVTTVTVAAGRDRLLDIGPPLLLAIIAHNSIGYTLGYWISRAFRLDKNSARAIAIEVGLQNGGMATTIAASLDQLATLGLAAAVFNPWMNFSGSILANYWRKRPADRDADARFDHGDVLVNKST
jgi:bile acid:Na+ symporter, BASS family